MQRELDDGFDVVIIADNPSLEVLPTTHDKPWALQRFAGFTLLDFCLEWVCWFDSPNVIVVTSTLTPDVCEQIQARWDRLFGNNIRVFNFKSCVTINDLLREVESRHLITRDFILVDNVATFCSSNLPDYLSAFKSRLRQNRNNVITLLYTTDPSRDCPLLGIQNYTNKLMHYSSNSGDNVKISKNLFVADTTFRTDLASCGIALCAHEFSGHFSGNYDFKSFDRIIHDVLSNEEFLGQNIHIEVVGDVHAFSANNYSSLLRAQSLLIRRVCFPLTFENILPYFKDFDRPEHHAERNVCVSKDKEPPVGGFVTDAVFLRGFLVHETATVKFATFGVNARIGKNATLRNCICGDGVNVGEAGVVEEAILESGVTIGAGARVEKCCYIGANINIPPGTVISTGTVLQSAMPAENLLRKYLCGVEAEGELHIGFEKVNDYYSWWLCRGKSSRRLSFWNLHSASAIDENTNQRPRKYSSHSQSSMGSGHRRGRRRDSRNELDNEEDAESSTTSAILDDDTLTCGDGKAQTGAYQSDAERFLDEVLETMSTLYNSDEPIRSDPRQIDKMKLEINASRLTNNVAVDDSAKAIFMAFLSLPDINMSFARLSKLFTEWNRLWANYYKRDSSKAQMLCAIEELANVDEKFRRVVPRFVKFLYDEYEDLSFIDEDAILDWHDSMASNAPLRVALQPLVDWLRKSDDDSEEGDEDSNE